MLKSALLYSDSVREPATEHLRSIYVSTFAIAFLGTPHEGSGVANWGTMLHGMVGHVGLGSEPVLIRTLRKDNETLDNLNTHFLNIMQKFEVALVYEAQKTNMLLIAKVVVPRKSAAPNWGGKTQTFSIEANVRIRTPILNLFRRLYQPSSSVCHYFTELAHSNA